MARGIAIVAMLVYHFVFDLAMFDVVQIQFNREPFWLAYRVVAMAIFVGLVGFNLVLAEDAGFKPRRLAKVCAGAAITTVSSYLTFPKTFIFFGILHFIAVASLLGMLLRRGYWSNLVLGLALIGLDGSFSHPWFDQTWLRWIGLMTHKPLSEDYVPLIPWFGVVLLGMFLARHLKVVGKLAILQADSPLTDVQKRLIFLGRHSLLIYLVHQPILIAAMYLVYLLAR